MKKAKFTSVILLIVVTVALFAFTIAGGSVKGTIVPINGALKAWAISQTDTFQSGINNGAFEINNVKAGTYRIVIEAVSPYKSEVRDAIKINDGEVTDLGEIRLQQ